MVYLLHQRVAYKNTISSIVAISGRSIQVHTGDDMRVQRVKHFRSGREGYVVQAPKDSPKVQIYFKGTDSLEWRWKEAFTPVAWKDAFIPVKIKTIGWALSLESIPEEHLAPRAGVTNGPEATP